VFPAPPAAADAILGQLSGEGRPLPSPGFLGEAVGSLHESVDYWYATFDHDPYVFNILKYGFEIPVKMTDVERNTVYRERNNQSARKDMEFVREELKRLLSGGQIVRSSTPMTFTNPLSVAQKLNADGTIKKRLVIDLSRRVN
jgi:hypothetical protein